MTHMLLQGSWKNLNVIKVDKNELAEHVPEHVINKGMENSRGVREAKGHNKVFIMPSGGVEGSFPLIPWLDTYKVVSIAQV